MLQQAPALRRYLVLVAVGRTINALLVVMQAGLLAAILVGVFTHHDTGHGLVRRLVLLAAIGLARAGLTTAQEFLSARASLRVRAELRGATLRAVVALGPAWAQRQPGGRLVGATGPGLDGLDGYVTRSLPALIGAVVVPVIVLARIASVDWQSGLLFILMLPLVRCSWRSSVSRPSAASSVNTPCWPGCRVTSWICCAGSPR